MQFCSPYDEAVAAIIAWTTENPDILSLGKSRDDAVENRASGILHKLKTGNAVLDRLGVCTSHFFRSKKGAR